MSLQRYQQKRRFDVTPEPAGGAETGGAPESRFVIQKHAARRLHFDLRLEVDGVLKSWAVPKGPSLNPAQKRLAVEVEDHPLQYADFEGNIPAGQYGAGSVIVWDHGTWTSLQPAAKALAAGKLKFQLHGHRLRGGWSLVRTGGNAAGKQPSWLLIKERDEHAIAAGDPEPVDTYRTSVLSERTLQQVDAGKPRQGNRRSRGPRGSGASSAAARGQSPRLDQLPPAGEPKLPRLVDHPPAGPGWVHELKLDGYRMQARVAGGQVQLLTRNRQDWTDRLPQVADALSALDVSSAIFDGELVALEPSGATDFSALQSAFRDGRTGQLVLFLFDMLYLNGQPLTDRPLSERKATLQPIIRTAGAGRLQFLDHIVGSGRELLDQCRVRGLEGIVSKRHDRGYRGGRADDWLKCKCRYREPFVVGGFTESKTSAGSLAALLVGYYRPTGELEYAGRIGTGWSQDQAQRMLAALKPTRTELSPFDDPEADGEAAVRWVRPQMVVEGAFGGWTASGRLRHASLVDVLRDRVAQSVIRSSLTVDHPPGDPEPAGGSDPAGDPDPAGDRKPLGESQQHGGVDRADPQVLRALQAARLSSADRVLYPEAGYTKLQIAAYFTQVSQWILPHLQQRPVTLVRCPSGIGEECFYQKHAKPGTPAQLRRVRIKDDEQHYLVVDDLAGLLAVAQMNVLELHPWGCRRDRLDRPDRLIFDLDPDPTVSWSDTVAAAWQVRERLEAVGLRSFVKTTGGKGLHLTVPIARRYCWDRAHQFTKNVAEELAGRYPRQFVATMSKQARRGRIFIDFHRNRRGATAIGPYSPRARRGAPVATPLAWHELTAELAPERLTIESVPARLATLSEDPWAELPGLRQSLPKRT